MLLSLKRFLLLFSFSLIFSALKCKFLLLLAKLIFVDSPGEGIEMKVLTTSWETSPSVKIPALEPASDPDLTSGLLKQA